MKKVIINLNNSEKDPKKKVDNPFSITESPENFFFFTGIILIWLYYNHDAILSWRHPTLILLYWGSVFVLSIITILALWFYTKILADVFLKPENLTKEAVIWRLKGFVKYGVIFYYLAYITLSLSELRHLIWLYVGYYYLDKIYVRIIKKIDFIAEPRKQIYHIRRNNRFLLSFPFIYLLTLFMPEIAAYAILGWYFTALMAWHNRWPGNDEEEEYIITKAPKGSQERLKLLQDAIEAFEDDLIVSDFDDDPTFDDIEDDYDMDELAEDEEEVSWGTSDTYDPMKEEHEDDDDILVAELKLERYQKKEYRDYIQNKFYPIHEYYLWWLMKDVPFYFAIKAFGQMFMDILCVFLRVIFIVPTLLLTLVEYALPLSAPVYHDLFWVWTFFALISFIPIGWLGLTSIYVYYSWCAFFYRDRFYEPYDAAHQYAMTGPTIDGPHTWQYWFYVLFSFFPSKALVFQEQLWEEEIRLAEVELELDSEFMQTMDEVEDYDQTMNTNIWNPINLFWLRNASPQEVQRYKDKIKEQKRYKLPNDIVEEWKRSINYYAPQFWRHYYI